MRAWSLFVALQMSSALVFAAQDAPEKKAGFENPALGVEGLFTTAGGLLLVLLVIVGLAWAFKRYGHFPNAGQGVVKVVGGTSLGPRERVVVVEIDATRLVLGVAPGQVRALHVMNASSDETPEFAARLKDELDGERR